jgi:hypothetical protein
MVRFSGIREIKIQIIYKVERDGSPLPGGLYFGKNEVKKQDLLEKLNCRYPHRA